MTKVITFRVNDEEQVVLDSAVKMYNEENGGGYGVSDVIKRLLKKYSEKRKGVEIPRNKVTKDEIAGFLNIGRLDKRWVTFMDKIEKTYYE